MASLAEGYAALLVGVLSCFDRMVITGTIPGWRHPEGMNRYLTDLGIRVFDYVRQCDEPLRDEIVATATQLTQEHGLAIEFICKIGAFRKEDRI